VLSVERRDPVGDVREQAGVHVHHERTRALRHRPQQVVERDDERRARRRDAAGALARRILRQQSADDYLNAEAARRLNHRLQVIQRRLLGGCGPVEIVHAFEQQQHVRRVHGELATKSRQASRGVF
jgi:hypothetical protein